MEKSKQKDKWIVVFITALSICGQTSVMFSPGLRTFDYKQHFNETQTKVNLLNGSYIIMALPMGIITMFLIDRTGLNKLIKFCCWSQTIGSSIRLIGHFLKIFELSLFGQFVSAFCQGINLAPGKVGDVWFESDERTLATALVTSGNMVGILYASLFGGLDISLNTFTILVTFPQIIAGPICFVIFRIFKIREHDRELENIKRNEVERTFTFVAKEIFQLFKNRNYILLAIAYMSTLGASIVIVQLSYQIMCPLGYTRFFIVTIVTTSALAAGVFGATVISKLIDNCHYKKHVVIQKSILAINSLAGTAFFFIIKEPLHDNPFNKYILLMACIFQSFLSSGCMGLILNLAVETTYPIGVGVSNGVLWVSVNVFAASIMAVIHNVKGEYSVEELKAFNSTCHLDDSAGSSTSDTRNEIKPVDKFNNGFLVMFGLIFVLTLAHIIFYKCEFRRTKAEEQDKDNERRSAEEIDELKK